MNAWIFGPLGRRASTAVGLLFVLGHFSNVRIQAQELAKSAIRDTAGLFDSRQVEATVQTLREIESKSGVPTIVETVDSLRGKSVDEVAVSLAKRSGMSGLFVLISKRETKIEVLPSHRVEAAFPRNKRNAIRSAFIEQFRKKEFDAGLKQGVESIAATLREAALEKKLPAAAEVVTRKPEVEPGTTDDAARKSEATAEAVKDYGQFRNVGTVPQLIVRGQVRLTLAGAQSILDAAQQHAATMKLNVNITVVDDGGHLLAFARMDGARPASVYTSMTKAVTAATFRAPSGPLPAGATPPDVHLNLSLQNAAMASGGTLTTLLGGIPVIVDGQVIGGVGVGGGTGEQDAKIARAGVEALLAAIKSNEKWAAKAAETPKPATASPATPPKEKTSESKPGDDRDF